MSIESQMSRRCMQWLLVVPGFILCLQACNERSDASTSEEVNAEVLYSMARAMALNQQDSALVLLEMALANGLVQPMRMVQDSAITRLVLDPGTRPRMRELLLAYATDTSATIAPEWEAGERIIVRGVVLDEELGTPIKDVVIELVHTDSTGLYFSERSLWNPRLFGYFRTGGSGSFIAHTTWPGSYGENGSPHGPSHIHFSITKKGYRPYYAEFVFNDDSLMTEAARAQVAVDRLPIAVRDISETVPTYDVRILLQPDVD